MKGSVLFSIVRVTAVVFLVLLGSQSALSYSFSSGGDFKSLLDSHPYGHWDEVRYMNDPLVGVSMTLFRGNSWGFGAKTFSVVPVEGDSQIGTVPVLFKFDAAETLLESFDNFEVTPFDYHYEFMVTLQNASEWPDGPPLESFSPGSNESEITLNVPIGTSVTLSYFVTTDSVLSVHRAMTEPQWVPEVIDPSLPGSASVYIARPIWTTSLQIIPEPTTLSLLGLGSLALVMSRRKQ